MSEEEKKLKVKVDEYFEKYMCVSFNKFLENYEETDGYLKYYEKEINRLNNIINKLENYLIEMFNKTQDTRYCDDLIKLKELKENK